MARAPKKTVTKTTAPLPPVAEETKPDTSARARLLTMGQKKD